MRNLVGIGAMRTSIKLPQSTPIYLYAPSCRGRGAAFSQRCEISLGTLIRRTPFAAGRWRDDEEVPLICPTCQRSKYRHAISVSVPVHSIVAAPSRAAGRKVPPARSAWLKRHPAILDHVCSNGCEAPFLLCMGLFSIFLFGSEIGDLRPAFFRPASAVFRP